MKVSSPLKVGFSTNRPTTLYASGLGVDIDWIPSEIKVCSFIDDHCTRLHRVEDSELQVVRWARPANKQVPKATFVLLMFPGDDEELREAVGQDLAKTFNVDVTDVSAYQTVIDWDRAYLMLKLPEEYIA